MAERMDDWERLLSAERHVQALVPDLRERFDEVLTALEAAAGWHTARTQRPVLILGQLDGMLTGIRQLRRTRPLETEVIDGLRIPTLAERARIKVWLLATRNTVRDYLDSVVLLERLGAESVPTALAEFDSLYQQPTGASPLAEAVERLRAAKPKDLAEVDLTTYRQLAPPWNDWSHVTDAGQRWAPVLAQVVLDQNAGETE